MFAFHWEWPLLSRYLLKNQENHATIINNWINPIKTEVYDFPKLSIFRTTGKAESMSWNVYVKIDRFPSDVTTHPAWLCRWSVFHFKIINNLFNTEFPIRKITITTTSAISSGLRAQSPLGFASILTIL